MKSFQRIRHGAVSAIVVLGGCGGVTDEFDYAAELRDSPPVSWEEFRASAYKEPWPGGKYIVDGDVPLRTEEELWEYYNSWFDPAGALTVRHVLGADDLWAYPNQFKLSYCVSTNFGSLLDTVVAEMAEATASWSRLVGVTFLYDASQAASCDQFNSNVVFDVRQVPPDGFNAVAFFPSYNRLQRSLTIRPVAFTTNEGGRDFQGILRHELGHVLGFRHEHIWLACTAESPDDARLVNSYDVDSVMHYPQCRPSGTGGYRQTELDYSGAMSLYGLAPALIAASAL